MPRILKHPKFNSVTLGRIALMIPVLQIAMLVALIKDWRKMKARLSLKKMGPGLKEIADSLRKQGFDEDARNLDEVVDAIQNDQTLD